ncbi:hypothetical protein PBS_32920 [Paraburkholderia sp. 2C]
MRLARQPIRLARFICDADRDRRHTGRAPSRERAVVIAAAVTEPVAILIEADTRHEDEIGHHVARRGRHRNAMLADCHRHVGRPGVKRERRMAFEDDWNTCFTRGFEREPCRDRGARVEFAFERPVKTDAPRRMLAQHIEHAPVQRGADARVAARMQPSLEQHATQSLFR